MDMPSQENLSGQTDFQFSAVRQSIFDPLDDRRLRTFKIGALILYMLSYFYAATLLDSQTIYYLPIAVGLVGLTEYFSSKLSHPFSQMETVGANRLETMLFLTMTLTQALSLSIGASIASWNFSSSWRCTPALSFIFCPAPVG